MMDKKALAVLVLTLIGILFLAIVFYRVIFKGGILG